MKRAKRETIQDRLGCFGYFGFGGGWEMARRRRRVAHKGGQPVGGSSYCNACRIRIACVERHKERARELFPDAMALYDQIEAELEDFPESYLVTEWRRRTKSEAPPPPVAVATGNMRDGALVARELNPEKREEASLTWPLVQLFPIDPPEDLEEATDDA